MDTNGIYILFVKILVLYLATGLLLTSHNDKSAV